MGLDGIVSGGADVGDVRPDAGELLTVDEGVGDVRLVLDPTVDVMPVRDPAVDVRPVLDPEKLDGEDTPLDGDIALDDDIPADDDTALDEESGDPSPFEEDVPSEVVDPIGLAPPRLEGPAGRDDRDGRVDEDEDGDEVVPLVLGLPNVVMDAPALGLHGSCTGIGLLGGVTGEVGLCIDPGVCAAGFVEGGDAGFV